MQKSKDGFYWEEMLMRVLSSSNPVLGFQGGTVKHTAVTKMERISHGFGHYSSYKFYPIYV